MALIDLSRVRQLSEYSHLEMQASILYQQNWNDLNGPKVLQDLIDNSGLWQSFIMTHQYFETDKDGFMLGFLIEELWKHVHWSCQKPNADTLYLYAANNQDETVSKLVALGKDWSCDIVNVYDGIKSFEECNLGWQTLAYLRLYKEETVMVEYWWD